MDALERIAPSHLAQEWDNVGLLAGDPEARCERVLLCIDMTEAVVQEAARLGADLIVAYHPPIWDPLRSLRADSRDSERLVWHAARHGMAIYALHTALDAAKGGTCDVLAALCDLEDVRPATRADAPGRSFKIVVFVPPDDLEKVAEAMHQAGAGHIGDYDHCSFRIPGTGTFRGGPGTSPTIGQAGRLEHVQEIRLEVICGADRLADVIDALRQSHPYEEPAYDIYPLRPAPLEVGMGRVGRLSRPVPVTTLARRLRNRLREHGVAHLPILVVGNPQRQVSRVAVYPGSAGLLPLTDPEARHAELIVTGEIRHHHALAFLRADKCVLALGHWSSERPVLQEVAAKLASALPELEIHISEEDAEPFHPC